MEIPLRQTGRFMETAEVSDSLPRARVCQGAEVDVRKLTRRLTLQVGICRVREPTLPTPRRNSRSASKLRRGNRLQAGHLLANP